MKIETPNNIDVLLHFYCTPVRHEREDAPAVVDAISYLLSVGAITPDKDAGEGRFRTTPKGKAWVEALCRVEEPRPVWVDDQGNILYAP